MASQKHSLSRGIIAELLNDEYSEKLKNNYAFFKDGVTQVTPGGWMFPGRYHTNAHFILDFEYSENDILVMTFPKSGTTWAEEICWNLLNNPDQDNPVSKLSSDFRCLVLSIFVIFSLSGSPIEKFVDGYAKLFDTVFPGCRTKDDDKNPFVTLSQIYKDTPGPRVCKIHHSFSLLPGDLLEKTKVVYIARNVFDVVNSYYHFFRLNSTAGIKGDLDQFVDDFVAEKLPFCPYYKHMKEAWDRRDDPNMLFLFYEDLKNDAVHEIRKIDAFIGTRRTEDQIKGVAEFTSFDSLKERFKTNAPTSYSFAELDFHVKESGQKEKMEFYRKGEIDDWKNYFSKIQMEKLNSYAEKNLKMFGKDFKYAHEFS